MRQSFLNSCRVILAILANVLFNAEQVLIADEYIKLPVLVNFSGFEETPPSDPTGENEFSAEALMSLRSRLVNALNDANEILKQCKKEHGTAEMRLGDPDGEPPKNIHFKNRPTNNADGTPTPDGNPNPTVDDLKKFVKSAKTELAKKFKKGKGTQQKGMKIYVVSGGLGDKPARGQLNQPVLWIKGDNLSPKNLEPGQFPQSGPFIVHELLHNSGLKDHTTDHGNVLNSPTNLKSSEAGADGKADRGLTKAQCESLVNHFKKYGAAVPNAAQETGFVPEPEKSHYALVTNPTPVVASLDHLGILEYSIIADNRFVASLSWDQALPREAALELFVSIDELDTFLEIGVIGEADGQFSVEGNNTTGGVSRLMETLRIAEGGVVDALQTTLNFEIELPESRSSVLSVDTIVVDAEGDNERLYSTVLESVARSPVLHGLPTTAVANDVITISGEHFDSQEPIALFIEAMDFGQLMEDDGFFSMSVTVPELLGGDYLVEAVAPSGDFAIGVLTVVPEPSTISLSLLGLTVLALSRRRRRRKRNVA